MNAEELRKLRIEQCWTQQEIGEVIGVNRNVVTKWELGLHRIPRVVGRFLMILTNPVTPRDTDYWMEYDDDGAATKRARATAQKGRTPQRQSKRIAGHVQPAARR